MAAAAAGDLGDLADDEGDFPGLLIVVAGFLGVDGEVGSASGGCTGVG